MAKVFMCSEEGDMFTIEADNIADALGKIAVWNAEVLYEVKPSINPRTDPDKYMEAFGDAGENG